MRPRDVLAENLKALMKAKPELARFDDIEAASDKRLTNGTLDRIRRAAVATTVDRLADIAEAFGVEPWQLLVEGLNPEALPSLTTTPLLEEIRSLVAAQATPVAQSASRHQNDSGSSLDRAIKTETKGATDAESNSASRVSKPRSGRDVAGNARARRSR